MMSLKLIVRGIDLSKIPNPVGSAARYSVRVESDIKGGNATLRGEPIDIIMLLKYWGMTGAIKQIQESVLERAARSRLERNRGSIGWQNLASQ